MADDQPRPDERPTGELWLDQRELVGGDLYETYETYDDVAEFRGVADDDGYDDDGYDDDGYEYVDYDDGYDAYGDGYERAYDDDGVGYDADEYDYYDDDYDYYDDGYDEDEYDEDGYDSEDDEYDDERAEPEYYGDDRDDDPPAGRSRGKRTLSWLAAVAVLVLLAGGAYFGARELLGFGYADYSGTGDQDVVVEVEDGDTTRQIAVTLAEANVVASAEAFVAASEDAAQVRAIQPGYYVVQTRMSGENAVDAITADKARVGHFQVRPGLRLMDATDGDGSVTERGILSRLSEASCAKLNGQSTCVSVEKLTATVSEADLAKLGVPDWAVEDAAQGEGVRKIEGLIAPGHYNVRPGSSAQELLHQVLTESADRLQLAGLPDVASGTGYGPYEVLIIASLIQQEAIKSDFAKVSRVIYNRLDQGMPLQFDSTVNYLEQAPTIRTSDAERAKDTPYNTYQNTGLPPTPISSASPEAIKAAANPAEGQWLYFVKCQKNGKSCFSETYAEHQKAVADAQERGVY